MAMTRRLDVLYPMKYTDKQGVEQTKWYNAGQAFENDNGQISVIIHMLPSQPPGEELRFVLLEPRSNGPRGRNGEDVGDMGF